MKLNSKLKKIILNEVNLFLKEIDAATSPGEVPIRNLTKKEIIDVIKTSLPGNTKVDKILNKFSSLKEVIINLFTEVYNDYIQDIFVVAPKPTMFKVVLKNAQVFYLTYNKDNYTAQISGKKYYLLNIDEQQRALKALSNILNIGNIPQTLGPGAETPGPDNTTSPTEEKPKGKPTGRPPKNKEEEEPEL